MKEKKKVRRGGIDLDVIKQKHIRKPIQIQFKRKLIIETHLRQSKKLWATGRKRAELVGKGKRHGQITKTEKRGATLRGIMDRNGTSIESRFLSAEREVHIILAGICFFSGSYFNIIQIHMFGNVARHFSDYFIILRHFCPTVDCLLLKQHVVKTLPYTIYYILYNVLSLAQRTCSENSTICYIL